RFSRDWSSDVCSSDLLFYSSNAVMGIMRSFDRNYAGFRKRGIIHSRVTALRITLILYLVVIISVILLIIQDSVLGWLGITNVFLVELIKILRWIEIGRAHV